jgi:hypothetical protein
MILSATSKFSCNLIANTLPVACVALQPQFSDGLLTQFPKEIADSANKKQ